MRHDGKGATSETKKQHDLQNLTLPIRAHPSPTHCRRRRRPKPCAPGARSVRIGCGVCLGAGGFGVGVFGGGFGDGTSFHERWSTYAMKEHTRYDLVEEH